MCVQRQCGGYMSPRQDCWEARWGVHVTKTRLLLSHATRISSFITLSMLFHTKFAISGFSLYIAVPVNVCSPSSGFNYTSNQFKLHTECPWWQAKKCTSGIKPKVKGQGRSWKITFLKMPWVTSILRTRNWLLWNPERKALVCQATTIPLQSTVFTPDAVKVERCH